MGRFSQPGTGRIIHSNATASNEREDDVAKGRHGKRGVGRGWKVVVVAVGVVGFLGAGTAYAAYRYDRSTATRILPGVTVDGVDVGDLTRDEAIRAVERQADVTLEQELTVAAEGETWTVTSAELGKHADVEAAIGQAFAVADQMSFFSRVWHRVRKAPVDAAVDLGFAYDDQAIQSFVQQAASEVAVPAANARIALVDGELVTRKAHDGRELGLGLAIDRIRAALERGSTSVDIPVKVVVPEVRTAALGETIVVDISDTTLMLLDGLKVQKQYRVATAAPGYVTPVGMWKVINKVENPTWYNPAPDGWGAGEPLVIPPGPGNPLGTRALYLNAPGIRIHGTYSSSSIGTHASHGCIRMLISEAEELYPLVPVGTRVIIKP
jgi:lipoprotein-anchoring transpeptidase ErfK/SrfK